MNAKKCKALRRAVRNLSAPGEPLRQLVGYRQPMVKGGYAVGAINSPWSFRGRYRALKYARIIDPTRIVTRRDEKLDTAQTRIAAALPKQRVDPNWAPKPPKPTLVSRVKSFFRRAQGRGA